MFSFQFLVKFLTLKGLKGGNFDSSQTFPDNSKTGGDISTKC